jgi:hypothetical protein
VDEEHICNLQVISLFDDENILFFVILAKHEGLLPEEIELLFVHWSVYLGIEPLLIGQLVKIVHRPILHEQLKVFCSRILGLIAHVFLLFFFLFLLFLH